MAREFMNSSIPRRAARASESVSRTLSVGEGFTPSRVFRHAFRAGIDPAPYGRDGYPSLSELSATP